VVNQQGKRENPNGLQHLAIILQERIGERNGCAERVRVSNQAPFGERQKIEAKFENCPSLVERKHGKCPARLEDVC